LGQQERQELCLTGLAAKDRHWSAKIICADEHACRHGAASVPLGHCFNHATSWLAQLVPFVFKLKRVLRAKETWYQRPRQRATLDFL